MCKVERDAVGSKFEVGGGSGFRIVVWPVECKQGSGEENDDHGCSTLWGVDLGVDAIEVGCVVSTLRALEMDGEC